MYMIDIEKDGEGRKNFIAHLTHLTSHYIQKTVD